MPEADRRTQQHEEESRPAKAADTAWRKVFSALLALVFAAVSLVLPPVANHQLAEVEKQLQKPALALVVAVVIALISAWRSRLAIGVAVAAFLACLVHVVYFVVTTAPGRDAASQASLWTNVPLASGARGVAENHRDVFGSARLNWSGNQLRLDLRSNTGTTQQGFWLNGGPPTSRFYFQARIDKIDGGQVVSCPLLFGIQDPRDYFTFRLHTLPDGPTAASSPRPIR